MDRHLLPFLALLSIAVLAAAGCGSDEDADDTVPPPTSAATPPAADDTTASSAADERRVGGGTGPSTDLTIRIWPQGQDVGEPMTYTLTCGPDGGTLPDPAAACAAIQANAELFTPVPPDAICTMQYGGPQVAEVQGRVQDIAIDATFTYTNGCEIARWDRATSLLPLPVHG